MSGTGRGKNQANLLDIVQLQLLLLGIAEVMGQRAKRKSKERPEMRWQMVSLKSGIDKSLQPIQNQVWKEAHCGNNSLKLLLFNTENMEKSNEKNRKGLEQGGGWCFWVSDVKIATFHRSKRTKQ